MSAVLTGSPQYLSLASAFATAYPYTFSIWAKITGLNNCCLMSLGSSSASDGAVLQAWSDAANYFQVFPGGTYATASGSYSTGVWTHFAIVATNATSRTIYRDGANSGSDTNSNTHAALNRTLIGARMLTGSVDQFAIAKLAEPAGWTSALSGGNITSLAGGSAASSIGSPAFYETLLSGAGSLTNNGSVTFDADHPTITGGGGATFRRRSVCIGL
jgi:hypothetical protein